MALTEPTQQKLIDWVGISTWSSGNPHDEERFYDFVYQYYKDHGASIDESSLQQVIKNQLKKCDTVIANVDEEVREYVSLAVNLCRFLKHHKI